MKRKGKELIQMTPTYFIIGFVKYRMCQCLILTVQVCVYKYKFGHVQDVIDIGLHETFAT